jgi:hypothetical protein
MIAEPTTRTRSTHAATFRDAARVRGPRHERRSPPFRAQLLSAFRELGVAADPETTHARTERWYRSRPGNGTR